MNCTCTCHNPSMGGHQNQTVEKFVGEAQDLAISILHPKQESHGYHNGHHCHSHGGNFFSPTTYNIGNNYGGGTTQKSDGMRGGNRVALGIFATVVAGVAAFFLAKQNTEHEDETMKLNDIRYFERHHALQGPANNGKALHLREVIDYSKKITKGRRNKIRTNRLLTIGVLAAAALIGFGAVVNAPAAVIGGLAGLGVAFVIKMYLWGSENGRAEKRTAEKLNTAANNYFRSINPLSYNAQHCENCDVSDHMWSW